MREAAEFAVRLARPTPLAGKRLRNRITHASMSLLATPAGRVTERFIQYHANRAAGGAAMTVTEPLGMMRHQSGLPRVQVWRRDDGEGLKRFAEAVESQDCRLLGLGPGCRTRPPLSGTQSGGDRRLGVAGRSLLDESGVHALTAGNSRSDRTDRRVRVAFEGVRVLRRRDFRWPRASVSSVPVAAIQPAR